MLGDKSDGLVIGNKVPEIWLTSLKSDGREGRVEGFSLIIVLGGVFIHSLDKGEIKVYFFLR